MTVETQSIHGLDGVLAALQSLPQEIVSKNGGVVRVALRKGAVVFVDEAKRNVQKIIATPNIGGQDDVSTGALVKAIGAVKARHPELQGANEMYTVKARKASRVRNLTPAQYGRDLEIGTERQTAKPWMTPAYFSKRNEALEIIVSELHAGIEKAIVKATIIGNTGR